MAAATEVRPSSSGTAAATTAPNASSRITSVIGSEITSARWRSFWRISSKPLSTEPPPAWCSVASGWARAIAATVRWIGATCSEASSGSPRSVTWTSTLRPPAVESAGVSRGPLTARTSRRPSRRASSAVGRGGGRGAVGRAHEDALAGRALHPGRDDLRVGAGRLARARLGAGQGLGAGHRAGEHAAGHEDQPQGDGGARPSGRRGGGAAHAAGERAVRGGGHGVHAGTVAAPLRRRQWGAAPSAPAPAPGRDGG